MKLAITRAIGDLNFKGYRKKDEELKEIMKEKSKSSFAELSLQDILRKGEDMVISAEPEFKHYDVKKNNNKLVMMGCDGIWENDESHAVYDECGICGGNNSACGDCAGIPNGDSVYDNCDTCDNDPSNDCVGFIIFPNTIKPYNTTYITICYARLAIIYK
jgi:hypothetical protein